MRGPGVHHEERVTRRGPLLLKLLGHLLQHELVESIFRFSLFTEFVICNLPIFRISLSIIIYSSVIVHLLSAIWRPS